MTKQEYESKIRDIDSGIPALPNIVDEIWRHKMRYYASKDYIASLESDNQQLTADNAKLEKALDLAAKIASKLPCHSPDKQCDSYCIACWKEYFKAEEMKDV